MEIYTEHNLDMLIKPIKLKDVVIGFCVESVRLRNILSARAKEIEKLELFAPIVIDELPTFSAVKVLILNRSCLNSAEVNFDVLVRFPNVQDLRSSVGHHIQSLDGILQKNHLKKLRLSFEDTRPQERFDALFEHIKLRVTLESLDLTVWSGSCLSVKTLNNICEMTNLKKLRLDLSSLMEEDDLLKIARSLKQLRFFKYALNSFRRTVPKDTIDIKLLCKFVVAAKNLETFIFDREHISLDVFNQFYYELSELAGVRRTPLNMIVMVSNEYYREKDVFLQKNSWLKMRISVYARRPYEIEPN